MKYLIIFILFGLFLVPDISAGDFNNLPSQIQDDFDNTIKTFYQPLRDAALYIFVSLSVIQLVLTFGFMALRGEIEFGGVMSTLIRYILLFGLFYAFLQNTSWMVSIFNGFTELANKANGGTTPSLDGVIEHIGLMWENIGTKVDDNGLSGMGTSFLLVIIGAISTGVIFILSGQALMTYGFFVFSLYVGVFWLGFAGLDWTRQWAYNSVINIIRWGAKWMMMLLIIGVTFTLLDQTIQNADSNLSSYLKLLAVSLIMVTITTGSSGFVDSYFNGHGGGDNNRGVALAQSMVSGTVGGAVAGAAAGYSSVKEAAASSNPPSGSSFKSSAMNFMKSTSAGATGAVTGAAVGAAKGGFGMSTHGAGTTTGKVAGSMFAGRSNTNMVGNHQQDTSSSFDRSGFDLNQLNGDISSSTEN